MSIYNNYARSIKLKKISLIFFNFLIIILIFLIIFSIPLLESQNRNMMGIILIPLLIILDLIIMKRYCFIKTNEKNTRQNALNDYKFHQNNKPRIYKREISENKILIFHIDDMKFYFSRTGIIIFFCGTPLFVYFIYVFFEMEVNIWIQEITTKQANFIFNLISPIKSNILFSPGQKYPWIIAITQSNSYFLIEPWCTAVHVFSIFSGIIICIPHSQDPMTSKDIIWRKTKMLFISIVIIYMLNLLRIAFMIHLIINIGISFWIHDFLNYVSGFIAALIFIALLYKWVPEIYLSIYYSIQLISNKD